MLKWLKSQPDMYERLEQIRELEEKDHGLDHVELELLELVQSIGATSFRRIVQQKSDEAAQQKLEESNSRRHGKKN